MSEDTDSLSMLLAAHRRACEERDKAETALEMTCRQLAAVRRELADARAELDGPMGGGVR